MKLLYLLACYCPNIRLKLKKIPGILPLLFLSFQVTGQVRPDSQTASPLQIGDTIPAWLWDVPFHVVDHPAGKDSVTLADYRDNKLILLDFWATWCTGCILQFPKLDSLKAQFEDLEVVLVNNRPTTRDNYDKVKTVMDTWSERYQKPFPIPSIIDDGMIRTLFPATSLPHYIWIGREGVVMAITSGKSVTRAHVQAMLEGRPLTLPVKDDIRRNDSLTAISLALQNAASTVVRDTLQLDEVQINTGYQQLRPNEINGSIAHVDRKTLDLQVGTNILDRLDGVTSGLTFNVGRQNTNPQNKTGIVIRGHSTINGPLDPLIVLDNFVYEGDIDNINPNTIESVTVLKDAAATSIYGARGGNGVIVITTRKGGFDQPVSVNGAVNRLVTERPDLSGYQQMTAADYIGVEQQFFNQGFFDYLLYDPTMPALTPAVEVFQQRRDGLISAVDSASRIGYLTGIDARDQYTRAFLSRAITNQYSADIRGGSARMAWLLSGNLDQLSGHSKETGRRINFQASNTYKPVDPLTVTISAYVTDRTGANHGIPDYRALTTIGQRQGVPYVPLYDADGHPVPVYQKYRVGYVDTAGGGLLEDWRYLAATDYQHNRMVSRTRETVANAGITYRVITGLNLQLGYQHQSQRSEGLALYGASGFYTRDLINRFAQINETYRFVNYIVPQGGVLNTSLSTIRSQNFRSQLDFARRFGNHAVSALGGFEARESRGDGNSSTVYGYVADPLSMLAVDNRNAYPTRPAGYWAVPGAAPRIEPAIINRFVSTYGNFHYVYDGRYSINGSFRKDGSNIFGVNTNDRWKPLWSAGLGYEVSAEPYYRFKAVPYLKARVTLGVSGNVDLSRSAVPVAGFATNPADLGGLPYARIGTINNPSLRWEQSRQFNLGVDFATVGHRFGGSIDYYTKKGSDLYGPTNYDYTAWGAMEVITMNVADMAGYGLDVQLRASVLNGSAFTWHTNLLYNLSRNRTTAYYDQYGLSIQTLLSGDGRQITPVVGKPLYAIAAYRSSGLDPAGNPVGYLNGEHSTDYAAMVTLPAEAASAQGTVRYVGSAIPTHFGALTNTFSYRGISMDVNVLYKLGYYFRRNSISYQSLIQQGIGHPDFTLRWQQPGDEQHTVVPAFLYPQEDPDRDQFYGSSDVLVERGDHIRLQFVRISYQLSKGRIKAFPAGITLFGNVSNLGILWRANDQGLDPDYPNTIRPARTLAIGLRATL